MAPCLTTHLAKVLNRLAKDDTGVERYVRSVLGQESVRLVFRLRTGSAELLEAKKRCRMVSDRRCAICDSGVGEDVAHFLVDCGEFVRDQLVLLDDVVDLWGPNNGWMNFGEWTGGNSGIAVGKKDGEHI